MLGLNSALIYSNLTLSQKPINTRFRHPFKASYKEIVYTLASLIGINVYKLYASGDIWGCFHGGIITACKGKFFVFEALINRCYSAACWRRLVFGYRNRLYHKEIPLTGPYSTSNRCKLLGKRE